MRNLQNSLEELRSKMSGSQLETKEEEILFFKEQKTEILSKLLYFNKIFQIESKFPNGSDKIAIEYLNNELDSLTYFFNRNLDFYRNHPIKPIFIVSKLIYSFARKDDGFRRV